MCLLVSLSTKYTSIYMVYMNVCVYIIIYLCIYVYIVLSPLYIISLALTKISIFKEATRNHIKFFFSCRFFVWFFFYSLGVFLYTKSVLLAFIFIFFFRYICMCVYMYTYSLHMYVCMYVCKQQTVSPLVEGVFGAPALTKKTINIKRNQQITVF